MRQVTIQLSCNVSFILSICRSRVMRRQRQVHNFTKSWYESGREKLCDNLDKARIMGLGLYIYTASLFGITTVYNNLHNCLLYTFPLLRLSAGTELIHTKIDNFSSIGSLTNPFCASRSVSGVTYAFPCCKCLCRALVTMLTMNPKQQRALKMLTFVDLPEEIKTMIYEYCLVADHKIIRRSAAKDQELGPKYSPWSEADLALSLFTVNSAIREGALNTFYEKNNFELCWPTCTGDSAYIWKLHALRFPHVSVSLDSGDLDPRVSTKIFEEHLRLPSLATSSQQELAAFVHDERVLRLEFLWRRIQRILRRFTYLKGLDFNVENLNCPEGCCRLVRNVFGVQKLPDRPLRLHGLFVEWHRHDNTVACDWIHTFYQGGHAGLATMDIEVGGMHDEEEAEFMHRFGFACGRCPMVGKMLDTKACTRNQESARGEDQETMQ